MTHINRKIFIDNGEMIISTFRDSITESEGKWKTEAVEVMSLKAQIPVVMFLLFYSMKILISINILEM